MKTRTFVFVFFAFAVVSFLGVQSGYCEIEGGRNLGLYGGSLEEVVFDASSADSADHTIYARMLIPPGIYKTHVDGSSDWEYTGNSAATSIGIVQRNGYMFYASTQAMYRSTDGGVTWTTISDIVDGGPIKVVPIGSTDRIYVGAQGSGSNEKTVYYSTDYGDTWTQTFDDISATQLYDMDVSSDGNTIIGVVLSGSYEFYRWTNSGGTWTAYNPDLTTVIVDFTPKHVTFDPNDDDIYYISGVDDLITTDNGGTSHTEIDTAGTSLFNNKVYIPDDSSCFYIGGYKRASGIWTTLPAPSAINGLNYVYGVHPTDSSIVIASCDKGIAISRNAGVSFTEFDQGLEAVQIVSGCQDPTDSSILAYCAKSGIAVSTDGGDTCAFVLHGPVWMGMAVTSTGDMYACEAGADVRFSDDSGTNWNTLALSSDVGTDFPGGACAYQVFVDPVDEDIIYCAVATDDYTDGAIYKYETGAWGQIASGYPFISISGYASGSNSVLFAGFGDRSDGSAGIDAGCLISTDSGGSWTAESELADYVVRWVQVYSNNNDLVMAATGDDGANAGTIFVSADGGSTWTGTEEDGGAFTSVAFKLDATDTIDAYASARNKIYATTDNGSTWYKYYEGADNERFNCLYMFEDVLQAFSQLNNSFIVANGGDAVIQSTSDSLVYGSQAGVYLGSSSSTWYFGEGCTAYGYDTYFLIANPNSSAITVNATYYLTDGTTVSGTYSVAATSRYTIPVDNISGLEDTELSAKFESTNNASFYMERAMYWDNMNKGHDTIGATTTSTTWYLAEGCTAYGYDTYILIMNPSSVTANVALTFMKSDATTEVYNTTVGANSRKTIHADDIIASDSISTKVDSDQSIVVERAMYWDEMASGHCSIGTTSPSSTWYLAEGYTGGTYDTWVLIQNPNSTSVTCDVTFYINGEDAQTQEISVEGNSRYTIHLDDTLSNHEVSTYVNAGTSQVVCERAMYWTTDDGNDGHCSTGSKVLSLDWYLAEGYTGGGFDEWILIMNPGSTAATVNISYLKTDGTTVSGTYTVPATSRYTIHVDDIEGLESTEVSASITSDMPIAVERAMYFGDAGGHVSKGVN